MITPRYIEETRREILAIAECELAKSEVLNEMCEELRESYGPDVSFNIKIDVEVIRPTRCVLVDPEVPKRKKDLWNSLKRVWSSLLG